MVVLSATVGFNARPADVTTGPLDATLYDMLYSFLPIFLARKLSIIGNTVSLAASPTDPTGLGVQGRWKVNTAVVAVNVPLGTPGTVYIFADLSNTAVKTLTLVASLTNTPAAYQQLLGTVAVAGGAVVAGSLSLSGNVPTDPNTLSVAGDWRLTQGAASPIRSVFTGAVTDTLVVQNGTVGVGVAPSAAVDLTLGGTVTGAQPTGLIVSPTLKPNAGGNAVGVLSSPVIDTGNGVVAAGFSLFLNAPTKVGANGVTSVTTLTVNVPTVGATNIGLQLSPPAGAIAQEAWTAPTLGSPWVNAGGAFTVAGFMRDTQGRVWLRGRVNNPLGTAGVGFIMTLPLLYRPTGTERFICDNNGAAIIVTIDNAGVVSAPVGGVQILLSLAGISFATN